MRRHGASRAESGSAAVEFMGLVPLLILAALAAWQILLAATSATAAENAARAGSRASSASAAREALPAWLADDASIGGGDDSMSVTIRVPILVPGLNTSALTITHDAAVPGVD